VIEAEVFDPDGVLIDSEPVWERVRRGLVDERGGTWLPDAQNRLMGISTPEWASYLHDELGVDLGPEQIASTVMGLMTANYAELPPTMLGAENALRRIGQRWRRAGELVAAGPHPHRPEGMRPGPNCSALRSRLRRSIAANRPRRLPFRRTAVRRGTWERCRGRGLDQRTPSRLRSRLRLIAVPRPENPSTVEALR